MGIGRHVVQLSRKVEGFGARVDRRRFATSLSELPHQFFIKEWHTVLGPIQRSIAVAGSTERARPQAAELVQLAQAGHGAAHGPSLQKFLGLFVLQSMCQPNQNCP